MDTRTSEVVGLDEQQSQEVQRLWQLWLAGALDEMPRFAPVTGDSVPVKPKSRRKRVKRTKRSYLDFCNG